MQKIVTLCLGVFLSLIGYSQITATVNSDAQALAELLAGPNITVTNATLTGSNQASGSFTGTSNIGVPSGVILSTGDVTEANGANNSASVGADLGTAGTAEMDALANATTEDAVILQFDFEVQSEFIQFDYVFASEEYPEYAPPNNSSYNDVFAFYISGPGITGSENIAIVPNTSNAVAINNINAVTNNQYYVDNAGGTSVQFDGFTTLLTAKKEGLIPCNTYTLRLVIADAGDGLYSSAVFLKENSLVQGIVDVNTQTVNSDDIALEGCIRASFSFSIDQAVPTDTDISYQIGGTATNGIDYETIDTVLTIPAGQTEATVYIEAIQDGFVEGQESIYIIYRPQPCLDPDTAYLYIDDAQPIEFSTDGTDLTCHDNASGIIDFDASGGFPPYTYHVTTDSGNGTTTTYNAEPITGLDAGIYSVQVYDIYGCKAEALVIGGSFDAGQTFLPDGSGAVYTSDLEISGFGNNQTLDDIDQLQQICMNLEHSYMGDLQLRVISPSGESVILKNYPGGGSCDLGEPIATAPVDGSASSTLTDPGTGYDYCFNATPDYGTMVAESNNYSRNYTDAQGHNYTDNYLPAGSYTSANPLSGLVGSDLNGTWTIEVTDNLSLDNGYIFNWNIVFGAGLPDTLIELEQPTDVNIDGFITQAQCGGNDGSINISVSGDYEPYTFLWSNGETTEDISNLAAGTYEVFVTDDNSCTDSAEFILNNISSINISSTITQVLCSGGTNGAVDISVSGGTAPYTFAWSNAATTEDVSGLAAGDYTVTITDANGCTFSETIAVTEIPGIQINGNTTDEQCGTWNGTISTAVTGGSGSYGYSWSNGATTPNLSNLQAGSYTVNIVDGNGCTAQESFTVINDVSNCSQFCYLTVSAAITDDQCGQGVGAIDVSVTDATSPYTFVWSNASSSEDQTGLSAGTYTITVTDANQCEETQSFTVGNNTGNLVVSNSSVTDEICGNGQGGIDIEVSGGSLPYTYSWSNNETSQDLTTLSAGDYSVIITDGAGCTFEETFSIANNTGNLMASGTVINEVCSNANGGVDLTISGANGAVTYLWSDNSTLENLTGVGYGSYTCTITDQSGCTFTTDPFIVNNSSGDLSLDNQTVTNESCSNANGAIDVTVSGTGTPYTFAWSNSMSTEDISGLTAGVYSLTVTDANGCTVNTGNINVFNDASDLEITTNFITNEICGNQQGAVNVDVTGGDGNYTYAWSNASTSQDISNVSAGNYTLTVTDGNGCATNHSATVQNTSGTLIHTNSVITDEVCGNSSGAINITISGGQAPINYLWSNSATTEDISGLSAGTYTVSIVDGNGCELEVSETVDNNAADLSVSQIVTAEICSNGLGSIDLSVTGGQAPYTFTWSNSASTEDVSGLSAGTYSCTITDDNGCSISTGAITISNNPGTLAASELITNESCGQNDGGIDLTISGGQFPYTFTWSNTATTEDVSGLSAGSYSYTVSDVNNCVVSNTIEIENNAGNLSVVAQSTDELCDDNAGSIDLTISGGQLPYTFAWSNTATTEDLTGLNSGNYSCLITDNNGCSVQTGNIVVSNNAGTLSLDNVVANNEQCGNGLGSINITVSGGQPPYTYAWSNAAITEDLTGLSSGTYSCVITDDNGCSINAIATVGNSSGSLAINGVVTNETCNNSNGGIDATIQGGSLPYNYAWSNTATSEDLAGISSGNYTLTVTDNGGCSATQSFMVSNIGGNLNISNASITEEICGNGAGAINITVQDGQAPFTFAWSNLATTEDLSGLTAGNYSVTITDANGCAINENYTVGSNNGTLNIDNVVALDENCGDGNGSINVDVSGGSLPLNFVWSNAATTEDLSGLSAGQYDLEITDNYGCTANTSQTINNITGGFMASVATINDENCGDGSGSIDINVTGGQIPYTFAWSNSATTEDLSTLSAGEYTVEVTDANGCSQELTATVNNNTTGVEVSSVVVQPDQCGAGQGFIDLTISGGTQPYTYAWSNTATTEDISGLTEGDYTCQITDNSGCVVNATWTVTDASGGVQITSVVTDEICDNNGGSIDVTANGGIAPFSFTWDGQPASTCCDFTLNMFDTGNSWNGAFITVNINGSSVGDFTVPGGGANVGTFEACSGDLIELIWSSGTWDNEVSFNLTNPDGIELYAHNAGFAPTPGPIFSTNANCPSGSSNSSTHSGLSEGTYSLIVTDAVGCELTQEFEIENTTPNIQFVISNLQDDQCFQGNGSFDFAVAGGTAPHTTTLDGNGSFGNSFFGLNAGTYLLETTDANGCTYSENITINNFTPFDVSASVVDDNCGQGTGAIDVVLTGEVNPTFSWSNGAGTEDLSGLSAGNYTLTITDQGCTDEHIYTVVNNATFTAQGISTNESCSDGSGAIDVIVSGSGTYSYNWSNGADTEDLSNISSGSYDVIITEDGTGCMVELNFEIENDANGMEVTFNTSNDFCSQGQGWIQPTVTGGSGNYSFSWSNGSNNANQFNIVSGTYTLTLTDVDNNCTITETVEVENDAFFDASVASITHESCSDGLGAIDLLVTGGNPTFEWSNMETTEDISGLSAGTYTVTITDGFCIDEIEVIVENQTSFTVNSVVTDETCGDADGAIDLTTSGGVGSLTFAWSNTETTEDISGLSEGNYSVTITDQGNGCSISESFTITNNSNFTITEVETDASCATCNDGSIDITVSGSPVGNVSYSWSNSESTEDISNLLPGDYTVTVTDDSGCSVEATFTVEDMLGISENETEWNVSIYPNPSTSLFNIKYETGSPEVVFEVVNSVGQIIRSASQTGMNTYSFDLSYEETGMYFIRVTSNNATKTYRIILKK